MSLFNGINIKVNNNKNPKPKSQESEKKVLQKKEDEYCRKKHININCEKRKCVLCVANVGRVFFYLFKFIYLSFNFQCFETLTYYKSMRVV